MTTHDKRRSVLARAAAAALYHAKEGESGGGAPPAEPPTKPPEKPAPTPPQEPGTPQGLTEEQVKQRVEAALAERDRKQAEREQKTKAEREAEEAEKRGEFDKIKSDLKTQIAARDLDLKRRDVKDAIADYLRENHKAYAGTGVEKYILPQVTFAADTSEADIAKSVKAAADQYVTDNPRQAPPPGAPAGAQRGKLPAGTDAPPAEDNNGKPRPLAPLMRRF